MSRPAPLGVDCSVYGGRTGTTTLPPPVFMWERVLRSWCAAPHADVRRLPVTWVTAAGAPRCVCCGVAERVAPVHQVEVLLPDVQVWTVSACKAHIESITRVLEEAGGVT